MLGFNAPAARPGLAVRLKNQLKLRSAQIVILFTQVRKKLLTRSARFRNSEKDWPKKQRRQRRKRNGNMLEIEAIKKEYDELLTKLQNPGLASDWEKGDESKNSSRKSFLEKIIGRKNELEELKNQIKENESIISAKEDLELIALAETETLQLKEREKTLEKEIENLIRYEPQPARLASQGEAGGSVIVEIRAGAGGDEATLFVGDLFKMYSKYAESQSWKQRALSSHPSELGGFKEIIFELRNGNVFSKMKYEGGVHRVQRIPTTEKSGRVHTSTASVAILPKPKKTEIQIRPDDLKTDYYSASGPGGQYVNKRRTAIRITHLPSGIVVTSQTERSQLQNKENALSVLEAKLLERNESEAIEKISGKRRFQIGGAKRAEKIRTYNFPQDRLTDHRIKKSWHNLEEIINGKLDKVIEALEKNLA